MKNYAPLESEDGTARFVIEELRPAKGHFIARFSSIDDRASAERLAQVRLFVPRERMPAPAADEFYHADLIGLRAMTMTGEEIGTVTAVHDFGAGAVRELQRKGDEASRASTMVPFTEAFVPQVDIAAGRIVVAPPADSGPPPASPPRGSAPSPRTEPGPARVPHHIAQVGQARLAMGEGARAPCSHHMRYATAS